MTIFKVPHSKHQESSYSFGIFMFTVYLINKIVTMKMSFNKSPKYVEK